MPLLVNAVDSLTNLVRQIEVYFCLTNLLHLQFERSTPTLTQLKLFDLQDQRVCAFSHPQRITPARIQKSTQRRRNSVSDLNSTKSTLNLQSKHALETGPLFPSKRKLYPNDCVCQFQLT
jgi:hypothetical protein